MVGSHSPDEPRFLPHVDITYMDALDIIDVDIEAYGWRYGGISMSLNDDMHAEVWTRGAETMEIGWGLDLDIDMPATRLLNPIYINDIAWAVSSPADLDRVLELTPPLPESDETHADRGAPARLYLWREGLTDETTGFLPALEINPDPWIVDRDAGPSPSQRFLALEPDRVEVARGLLRDYPDVVPYAELTRHGLTKDAVSLVYHADTGYLPDATPTDPEQPPAAGPWRPTATTPDADHDETHHDRDHTAVINGFPDRVGEITPASRGFAVDDHGEDPEITAIRAAVDRLPDGVITDDDLARIGVTPEEFGQLVDADIDRTAEQYRAEIAENSHSAVNIRSSEKAAVAEIANDTDGGAEQADAAREPDTHGNNTPEIGTNADAGNDLIGGMAANSPEYSMSSANDGIAAAAVDQAEPDFDFWRDVIGDDHVVGGVVYSADLYTPDGEGSVRRFTDAELAMREDLENDAPHSSDGNREIPDGRDHASWFPGFDAAVDPSDSWLPEAGGSSTPDIEI